MMVYGVSSFDDDGKNGYEMNGLTLWVFFLLLVASLVLPSKAAADRIDKVIDTYTAFGFSAAFIQESILKAVDITDIAEGTVYIRRPGKMRWEYDRPEPQLIISNEKQLWIYKPYENQVMVGEAPDLFGDGKGAGFLANLDAIRTRFKITPVDVKAKGVTPETHETFQLMPEKRNSDFDKIIIFVNKETNIIDIVETWNTFGDITRIRFNNVLFYGADDAAMDDQVFRFNIPDGADVVHLKE